MNSHRLGSLENPHPITPSVKDRVKGHYYIYKNELRLWSGGNLRSKEQIKKKKEYREKNKEKIKKQDAKYSKKYREKNKEKIKKQKKEWYEKNKEKKKEKNKKYREKNKEKIKEKKKEYREKNKEKIKKQDAKYSKKYREKNKEKIKKQKKEWYEKNKEKIKEKKKEYREKNKDYEKDRYKNDPIYRIKQNMRCRVLSALKAQGASKNKRTMEYVNCCVELLYNHIESQFGDSGMNWDNMGKEDGEGGRGWEVDHRRPCRSFDLNDEEQKYMCFHWTNLQPMWGQENNEKGENYDPETYPYKWIDREIGWVGIPSYLMKK